MSKNNREDKTSYLGEMYVLTQNQEADSCTGGKKKL